MTNPNTTHITLVCDRSGSMQAIRADAEGAVNAFIKEQQSVAGEATLLLVDFDAPFGLDVTRGTWFSIVHDGDLATAPEYHLSPRGNTALRDAFGRGITMTGERLAAMPEDDRPGHVFFVLQTDGQENSSRDWTQDAINALIKEHEETWNWTFIFLAVGPDAWGAAGAYVGTHMLGANTVRSGPGGQSMSTAYFATASAVAATRSGTRDADDAYGADVDDEGKVTTKAKVGPKSKLP